MTRAEPFLPGATIGVMGGGQLGRMFAIAARRMGYRVHTFSPDKDGPAAQLSDHATAASYHDEEAVTRFTRAIDLLTFEFENIPDATIDALEALIEEMLAQLDAGDFSGVTEADVRFHHLIAEASENHALERAFDQLAPFARTFVLGFVVVLGDLS